MVIPAEAPYSPTFGFPTHELDGSITLEIADNYNMRPGSWTKTIKRPWSNCDSIGSFKQTVQWDVVIVHGQPTEGTHAREAADITGN